MRSLIPCALTHCHCLLILELSQQRRYLLHRQSAHPTNIISAVTRKFAQTNHSLCSRRLTICFSRVWTWPCAACGWARWPASHAAQAMHLALLGARHWCQRTRQCSGTSSSCMSITRSDEDLTHKRPWVAAYTIFGRAGAREPLLLRFQYIPTLVVANSKAHPARQRSTVTSAWR